MNLADVVSASPTRFPRALNLASCSPDAPSLAVRSRNPVQDSFAAMSLIGVRYSVGSGTQGCPLVSVNGAKKKVVHGAEGKGLEKALPLQTDTRLQLTAWT